MKVIFLQDVPRIGKKYDVKEVGDGYAINFLFPRRLAQVATKNSLANLEMRKKEITIEKKVQEDLLLKNLKEVKDKVVTLERKANDLGHLFEGIHKAEIVEQMKKEHRAEISEDSLVLEHPIKQVGEFEIPIEIQTKDGKNHKSSFRLVVKEI